MLPACNHDVSCPSPSAPAFPAQNAGMSQEVILLFRPLKTQFPAALCYAPKSMQAVYTSDFTSNHPSIQFLIEIFIPELLSVCDLVYQ